MERVSAEKNHCRGSVADNVTKENATFPFLAKKPSSNLIFLVTGIPGAAGRMSEVLATNDTILTL